MNIKITRINDTTYDFTANGFTFQATANPNNGQWVLPSYTKDQFGVMNDNKARIAHADITNFLKKNKLFQDTKKIDGKTNKRIYQRNPVFR